MALVCCYLTYITIVWYDRVWCSRSCCWKLYTASCWTCRLISLIWFVTKHINKMNVVWSDSTTLSIFWRCYKTLIEVKLNLTMDCCAEEEISRPSARPAPVRCPFDHPALVCSPSGPRVYWVLCRPTFGQHGWSCPKHIRYSSNQVKVCQYLVRRFLTRKGGDFEITPFLVRNLLTRRKPKYLYNSGASKYLCN